MALSSWPRATGACEDLSQDHYASRFLAIESYSSFGFYYSVDGRRALGSFAWVRTLTFRHRTESVLIKGLSFPS